ncbi:hypothetical protein Bca52824_046404 [Brassica carinata]|uniref:Uncharacterized protein n=1 Tax=Brassica carinata TaxID=52824 RepID=A0A8X7UP07_BRACI|nr:hypothetical protein Bca52824_046404 [Brassica carinata]
MTERKGLNQYYPAEFDRKKISRLLKPKNHQKKFDLCFRCLLVAESVVITCRRAPNSIAVYGTDNDEEER